MVQEPVNALLLAAGLSTRLGALSRERPKPLLPVCNVSLLRWAAAHCRQAGIRDVAVNLHHLGQQIQAELGDGAVLGLRVTYSPEPDLLGTGGGIKQMASLMPRRRCVVLNAKIVSDIDLQQVIAFHRSSGVLATLVVRPDDNAERWGAIGVDHGGRVTRILEHRAPDASDPPAYQFTGIHVLEPELIDAIPDSPTLRCVIRTAYRELLLGGAPIAGFVHRGYFYDHSTPARYLQGNLNLLRSVAAPPHSPGPLSGVDASACVDASAELVPPVLLAADARVEAGARVGPCVVLGASARVAAGLQLQHSVVWAGAPVLRSGRRLVVTPHRAVEVPESDDPAASPR